MIKSSWLSFVAGFWLGLMGIPSLDYIKPFRETTAYRTVTGLVPFKEVVVENSRIDNTALIVRGRMTKVRCVFVRMTASVERSGSRRWDRAWVDTSKESETKYGVNRPPGVQSWGEWAIRPDPDPRDPPTRWQIWAHHQCPEDKGSFQVNLFAEGNWENSAP